jgi:hypothetical protein
MPLHIMPVSIMSLSKMPLSIMELYIILLSIMSLSIMQLIIMPLIIMHLSLCYSRDTTTYYHNNEYDDTESRILKFWEKIERQKEFSVFILNFTFIHIAFWSIICVLWNYLVFIVMIIVLNVWSKFRFTQLQKVMKLIS